MSSTEQMPLDPAAVAPVAADAAAASTSTSDDADPTGIFSKSILISAVRCVLTYVIFPWVMPIVGRTGDTGPQIGAVIGVVAIGFNIASIRRFWISNHKWKWLITVLNTGVIILLSILLVQDIGNLI